MKREKDESYEDYKKRRKEENQKQKLRTKGHLYWNSSTRGTFTKEKEQKMYEEIATKIKDKLDGEE
jgi:hypothetical protein